MVGAGALVKPLLNFPHWAGVSLVGSIVIVIVVTAGMVSTTYVQFLKGGLLILFSTILTGSILYRGLEVGVGTTDGQPVLTDQPVKSDKPLSVGHVAKLPGGVTRTGPLGPIEYLRTIQQSEIVIWEKDANGQVYHANPTTGANILRPGNLPAFRGIRSDKIFDKFNFLSLMLALFCGTASLPHILIRYYTVKDQSSARKSTIVGIMAIGFFYILTLYMGLGAMTNGSLDLTDSNKAAPLLARSFSEWLFAVISAIAFTTVLGTVSGLIIAASGAIVHDLTASLFRIRLNEPQQVRVAKLASVVVGVIAIILGICFRI